jgi:hypothetical protein
MNLILGSGLAGLSASYHPGHENCLNLLELFGMLSEKQGINLFTKERHVDRVAKIILLRTFPRQRNLWIGNLRLIPMIVFLECCTGTKQNSFFKCIVEDDSKKLKN